MKTARKSFVPSYTLTDNGMTFTVTHDLFIVGADALDIKAALNTTGTAPGSAVSPSATVNTSTGQVSLFYANNVVWGSNVVWGNSSATASNVTSAMSSKDIALGEK